MSAPKLLTRQIIANTVAERWSESGISGNYYPRGQGIRSRKDTLDQLLALGPMPDPDEVDRVIGNNSWTRMPSCDGCGEASPAFVVQVGDEPDYESFTAHLCGACIAEAAALAKVQP